MQQYENYYRLNANMDSITDAIYHSPVTFGLGFVVLVLIVIIWVSDARLFDKRGRRIPGPDTNLFGQNFRTVMDNGIRNKRASRAFVEFMLSFGKGDMCGTNLYGLKIVLISHPDMIKTILSGNHNKFPKSKKYERLKFYLGNGLVTSSGARWQNHRHMINLGFHADALKGMVKIFNDHTAKFINQWKNLCLDSSTIKIDMNENITQLTLSIICDAGFGYKFETDESHQRELGLYFKTIDDEVTRRLLDPFDWWPVC